MKNGFAEIARFDAFISSLLVIIGRFWCSIFRRCIFIDTFSIGRIICLKAQKRCLSSNTNKTHMRACMQIKLKFIMNWMILFIYSIKHWSYHFSAKTIRWRLKRKSEQKKKRKTKPSNILVACNKIYTAAQIWTLFNVNLKENKLISFNFLQIETFHWKIRVDYSIEINNETKFFDRNSSAI